MDKATASGAPGRALAAVKVPANGDIVRVITDFVDTNNFHYLEVKFHNTAPNGYAKLIKRTGGSDTTLATDNTVTANIAIDHYIVLCINQQETWISAVVAEGHYIGNAIARITAATTPHGGDQIGVGTGGTMSGTLLFREVVLQNACVNGAQCAPLRCDECIDSNTVQTIKVVISGIVNDLCTACNNLNATYYVERGNSSTDDCLYTAPISPAICVGSPVGAPGYSACQLNMYYGRSFNGLSVQLINQAIGFYGDEWQQADVAAGTLDCDEFVDHSIPWRVDYACDSSGSTCKITSV